MKENHFIWYEHTIQRSIDAIVKRGEIINISGMMGDREKPKFFLIKTINKILNTNFSLYDLNNNKRSI